MLFKTERNQRKRDTENQISFPSTDTSNFGKLELGSLNRIGCLQNFGVVGLWFWLRYTFAETEALPGEALSSVQGFPYLSAPISC